MSSRSPVNSYLGMALQCHGIVNVLGLFAMFCIVCALYIYLYTLCFELSTGFDGIASLCGWCIVDVHCNLIWGAISPSILSLVIILSIGM